MYDLEKVNIAPIEHRALAHHGTERDKPQRYQRAIGPGKNRLVAARRSIFRQQTRAKNTDNKKGKRGGHQEMLPGQPAQADEKATQKGAGKPRQTPQPMIRG